jgi:hypothetical protein
MKNTYYFSVDIISNNKATQEDLDRILSSVELSCKAGDILGCILENMSLNFQSYVVINIESQEFQNNLSDQIDEIIGSLEEELPGGCTTDSRIEWGSDMEEYNLLWFKNKDSWEFSQIENELKRFGGADWEEDYEEDQDDRDSYW